MSEHSYRVVEILGISRDRIDAAIRNDVGRVSNAVRGLMGFRLDEGGRRLSPSEVVRFVTVDQDDPLAAPLLDELQAEYGARYGNSAGQEYEDLRAYPAEQFAAPDGVLVVAITDGTPVAGGAFRRYDSTTAELKRMWTASGHRRRGYGKLVVAELERIALLRGYTHVYLTTGWRQPEAVAMYFAMGYSPLYDLSLRAEDVGPHPFSKQLVPLGAPTTEGVSP